ncbi:hypothetical protein BOO24_20675 [Vibrio navarrensis]|uniref:CDP-glycerol glycerophosphotransferase family protein n=1 Tax=Vibrio navarrensis TaxID=29495 RepID=UPI00186AAB1C|nr:CDP-glycerol glycerophosphotransferase family protein [Vibrio navarrensis]MBE4594744.1 hypothetical protein [Vibrio navarrensis]
MSKVIRFLFPLFRLFSLINLNRKDFVIYDYTFGFNGHSRALYEYYVENFPESKVYFVTAKPSFNNNTEISRASLKGFYFMLFYRNFAITVGMPSYINLKRKKVVQFWHGTPMKSLGRFDKSVSEADILARCKEFNMYEKIIVQNNLLANSLIDSYMIKDTNRVLSLSNPYLEKIQARRKYYLASRQDDCFNVVYLPTYRNSVDRFWDLSANESFLSFLKSNNIRLYVRYHPSDPNFSSSEIEMETMLSIADILITDYSSVAFDAVDVGIVTLLSWIDYNDYAKERGLDNKFENYYVFPKFFNIDSLKESLNFYLIDKIDSRKNKPLNSIGMRDSVIDSYS